MNYIIINFLIYLLSILTISQSPLAEPPNIIFYLSDDQDQIDYNVYGNKLVPSDAVNRLASEGMKFENAFTTQAICAPSRSQIFTGLYPIKNGCYANHLPVKKDIRDINDYLQSVGYDVVLAGKSHVKPNSVFNWSKYFKNIGKQLPLENIKEFIINSKNPYCLIIASDYPHGPFPNKTSFKNQDIFKTPYDTNFPLNNQKGYYENILNDNNQLTEILDFIDDNELAKETLFIYASDHGLRGKWSVNEVGLKIPFIVRWPNVVKPGTTNSNLINLVDVLPTIIDATGNKIPKNLDGSSFLELLKGSKKSIRKFSYGISTRQNVRNAKIFPSRSVRDYRYKYIRNYNSIEIYEKNLTNNELINQFIKMGAEEFKNVPYEEFYDLKSDPFELNNLINIKRDNKNVAKLKRELDRWMVSQNDILMSDKLPLIKPTLHPLDKNTQWTKVPFILRNKLIKEFYIESHY